MGATESAESVLRTVLPHARMAVRIMSHRSGCFDAKELTAGVLTMVTVFGEGEHPRTRQP